MTPVQATEINLRHQYKILSIVKHERIGIQRI